VPLSFGLLHLTSLILEFSQAHPDIHIDVDFNDRKVNLIEEGMDLALRITEKLPETTVARRLTVCRFLVVLRRRTTCGSMASRGTRTNWHAMPASPTRWPRAVVGRF
jgi:DNA-binding transcriptional LysR family regulator